MTILQVPSWSRPFHIHGAMQYHHKVSLNKVFHNFMLDVYCTYHYCVCFKVSINNIDTHFLYHRFMANAVGKQLECGTKNIAPPTSPS